MINKMKRILVLFGCLFFLSLQALKAQSNMPVTGKDSLVGCSGTIHDNGGSLSDYSNNTNSQFIVKFPGGDSIRMQFTAFNLADASDSIVLFINSDLQSNKVGVFQGSVIPLGGLKITVPGSRLIVKQYSNGVGVSSGFSLSYQGVYPILKATITYVDTQVCVGKSLVLKSTVTGGVNLPKTYQWNGVGGVDTLKIDFPTADTSIASLQVTDYCSTNATDIQQVMTYEAISLLVSNDTAICLGSTISISALIVGGDRVHGGPGFYKRWSTGATTGGISVSPTSTTTYYVWGGEGCSLEGEDSVKVTVYDPLFLSSVSDTVICFDQTYDLDLVVSGGLVSSRKVTWSDPSINGLKVSLSPDTGITNYRVWVEDGCTVLNDTSDFVVVKRPQLLGSILVSPDTICYGDSTQITVDITGGRISSRSWTVNGNTKINTVYKEVPLSDLIYVLKLSDGGCSADTIFRDTLWVQNSPISQRIVLSDTLICYYDTNAFIRVSVTGGEKPVSHQWNNISKTKDTAIANLRAGNYKLTSTDAFGCKDSLLVRVMYEGRILSANLDTIIYRGGIAKLWMNRGGKKWKWLPDVAVLGTDTNRFLSVRPVKSQKYTVVALDSADCIWRDTVLVSVVDPPLVRIPNLITPNGDGENDFWDLIEMPNLEDFDIEIYDRPGNLVYRTSSYLNDWKAEDANGKQLLTGVYFYYIKNRSTQLEYRGFIQVVR